jgi:hypothetical protein
VAFILDPCFRLAGGDGGGIRLGWLGVFEWFVFLSDGFSRDGGLGRGRVEGSGALITFCGRVGGGTDDVRGVRDEDAGTGFP